MIETIFAGLASLFLGCTLLAPVIGLVLGFFIFAFYVIAILTPITLRRKIPQLGINDEIRFRK